MVGVAQTGDVQTACLVAGQVMPFAIKIKQVQAWFQGYVPFNFPFHMFQYTFSIPGTVIYWMCGSSGMRGRAGKGERGREREGEREGGGGVRGGEREREREREGERERERDEWGRY